MYVRIASAAFGAVCAIPVVWWLANGLDRSLPAEQGEIVITEVTPRYLSFKQPLKRKRSCSVQVLRKFTDSHGDHTWLDADVYSSNGVPGLDIWGQTVILPPALHPGPATLTIQKLWVCNPLQSWKPIEWVGSADFVVPPKQ